VTRLNGKVALITGSTDGVGRVVAKRLGDAGVRVLVHGRDRKRGEGVVPRSRKAAARRRSW
jgi:NAD(P)-dependent dehydrogenase (short-subunit alcohol dehydrogenase family)